MTGNSGFDYLMRACISECNEKFAVPTMIMAFVLNKFCFCCHLRTGVIVVAVISLVRTVYNL